MKKLFILLAAIAVLSGCAEKEEQPEPPRIAFPVTVGRPRHPQPKTKADTTKTDTTKIRRGINIINPKSVRTYPLA